MKALLLAAHGIREIAINLHYRPEAIVDHFGDGSRFGVRITYSPEPRLLGSAGAARRLDWFFDDPFLVLYGDVLTDVDLSSLVDAHRRFGGIATIALSEVDEPTRCGIVHLDRAGRIMSFVEKPTTGEFGNLANSGIYVLDRAAIDHVPHGRPFDFGTDLFPALLSAGAALYGVPVPGYVLDVGSPDRYRRAEFDLLAGRVRSYATGARFATEVGRC